MTVDGSCIGTLPLQQCIRRPGWQHLLCISNLGITGLTTAFAVTPGSRVVCNNTQLTKAAGLIIRSQQATLSHLQVASMHGELGKLQRQQTLDSFRRGKVRALLVSDVAARGLDVAECDAVFNLELPSNAAHYAHRAGRTGRMGAPGTVVTIASPSERFVVDKLGVKLRVPILVSGLLCVGQMWCNTLYTARCTSGSCCGCK